MDELDRIENLYIKINRLGQNEENFKKIEEIRIQEYRRVGGSQVQHKMESYGFNLRETGDAPAKEFKLALKRKSLKSAYQFDHYVNSLLKDIEDEILRIKRQIWPNEN